MSLSAQARAPACRNTPSLQCHSAAKLVDVVWPSLPPCHPGNPTGTHEGIARISCRSPGATSCRTVLLRPRGVAGLVQVVEPPGRIQEMLMDLSAGMPGNPWPAASRKRSRSVRSASSIAMMRYLPTCQAPKVAKRWGWRTSLMICMARSSGCPIWFGQAHELQRQLEPARPGGLPDFAEAAPAEPLDQSVSGDGLRAGLQGDLHCPRLRLWKPPG